MKSASVFEAGRGQPQLLNFVCPDFRLAAAAVREGFGVLPD
jgi:hypothetical protein